MKRKGIVLLSLICIFLTVYIKVAAEAVEQPKAAELRAGYIAIGTYIIYRDSLDPAILNASMATTGTPGTGIYYKSEFAGGKWFKLDDAVSIGDIADVRGKLAVDEAEIDSVKFTVWVDEEGRIISLMTGEELEKKIYGLNSEKAGFAEEKKSLDKEKDSVKAEELDIKIANADAESKLYEALKDNNQSDIRKSMELINDVEALKRKIAAESEAVKTSMEDSPQGTESAGEAGAPQNGAAMESSAVASSALKQQLQTMLAALDKAVEAGQEETAESLKEQIAVLSAEIDNKQVSGPVSDTILLEAEAHMKAELLELLLQADGDKAEGLFAAILDIQETVSGAGQKTSDKILALMETKADLEEQHKKAEEPDAAARLEQALDRIEADMAIQQKNCLFAQKDLIAGFILSGEEGKKSLEKLLDESIEGNNPQKQQLLGEGIEQKVKDLDILEKESQKVTGKIKAIEKSGYSEAEIEKLNSLGAEMKKENSKLEVLPVESLIVRGAGIKLEVPPFLYGGGVFIHIRPVSEGFGALVIWNAGEKSVTVSKEGTVAFCKVGSREAYLNGAKIQLDQAPMLVNGKTFIPLDFAAESLGLSVSWDEASQTAEINGFELLK